MTPRQAPPRLVLGVLLLSAGGYSLLQSLVVPALPTLEQELGASPTGAAWIFTSFLLATSVATPVVGRLGDMFGHKRVLVAVLSTLAAGTLLAALASSLPLMIAGRTVQGLGGAVFPVAFGIIREAMPPALVSTGISLMSGMLGLGGVLGIVLAGPILDHLSYHWLFWLPLGTTLVAIAATLAVVPESTGRAPGELRWRAVALFSASLVTLLLAVSKAPAWGWVSARTLLLATTSGALALGWLADERRARQPFIDVRLMLRGGLRSANLAAFLVGWATYSGFVLLPQYLQEPTSTGYGFGLSVTRAGLFLLPWTFGVLVASVVGGRVSLRVGSKWPLAAGAAIALAGFIFLLAERAATWELGVASATIGAGVGLAFASLPNVVVETVPAADTGVATGVNIIMRTVGGVVGTQVAISVVAAMTTAAGMPTERAYVVAFLISAVALVGATVAALLVPDRPRTAASALDEGGQHPPLLEGESL